MKRLLAAASVMGALACCIARGSKIRTPGGSRPIEDIRIGDEVFCVDPDTGRLVAGKVSATRSVLRECVQLSFGTAELIATSDHPLYCPDTKQWAPAGDWSLGKRTSLLHVDGQAHVAPIKVERTSSFAGVREVFDLTVDHPLHNFIANDILVHNKSPVQSTCKVDGGSEVSAYTPCTCSDGSSGYILCDRPSGTGTCAECAGTDGGSDGGSVDGGDGG